MTLPAALQSAVAVWLDAHSETGGSRRQAAAALSAAYRAGVGSQAVDPSTYLVTRLPATFAAVARVLDELDRRRPEFSPASLLDAGCGPGTASWVASALWPEIVRITLLDHDDAMLGIAAALARHGPPAMAGAEKVTARFDRLPNGLSADLTIAAYALAEVPLAGVSAAVRNLWAASGAMLALIEPGTTQGFARIHAARSLLLGLGAVPVAPCPHAGPCPMTGSDWCHFTVRLPRSRAHMHAKAATVPFEDEPFSYLVMARDGDPTRGARVLAPPGHAKPGIDLKLCADGEVQTRHVARREAAAYRLAKKLGWGDFVFPASSKEEDR